MFGQGILEKPKTNIIHKSYVLLLNALTVKLCPLKYILSYMVICVLSKYTNSQHFHIFTFKFAIFTR